MADRDIEEAADMAAEPAEPVTMTGADFVTLLRSALGIED
jgi:hypothetical protein